MTVEYHKLYGVEKSIINVQTCYTDIVYIIKAVWLENTVNSAFLPFNYIIENENTKEILNAGKMSYNFLSSEFIIQWIY